MNFCKIIIQQQGEPEQEADINFDDEELSSAPNLPAGVSSAFKFKAIAAALAMRDDDKFL